MKTVYSTKDAPAPVGPYSQAVEAGGFLFCSGQIAIDPRTNEVKKASVVEQAKLVMENVGAVLRGAGLDFHDVVKTTIFLTDLNDFGAVNEIYARYFAAEPPARSTVQVSALPKGVNVEVEVIAKR